VLADIYFPLLEVLQRVVPAQRLKVGFSLLLLFFSFFFGWHYPNFGGKKNFSLHTKVTEAELA
jgi:hypothetical protein